MRKIPTPGETSHALAVALVLLLAGGCDRMRRTDPRPPVPADSAVPADAVEPALPDHTDASSRTPLPNDRLRLDSGAIEVYFSRTHDGDAAAAASDPGSLDRRAAAFIGSAGRTLDCAVFEIESDRIVDALLAALDRGVRIRIVADADYRDNEEARRLVAAGVPIVWDERAALMHNKFIVADDDAVWTGSYNVTDNDAWRNDNNAVVIRSRELAENYLAEFEEMFVDGRFGPRSPSATPHTLVDVVGTSVYNYFSPEDEIAPKVARILRVAKRSIHVLAFSFTDTTLADELLIKSAAGLDVRVVLERRGSGGRGSVLERLRAGGVEVLTDGNPLAMHDKVMIVDSTWTITGSYNFSSSAARSNDENILFIKSSAVARPFEEEFGRIRATAIRNSQTALGNAGTPGFLARHHGAAGVQPVAQRPR